MDDNGDTVRQAEKHRATQQQSTAQWSKISTGLENGLLLKNAAQIFLGLQLKTGSAAHAEQHANPSIFTTRLNTGNDEIGKRVI